MALFFFWLQVERGLQEVQPVLRTEAGANRRQCCHHYMYVAVCVWCVGRVTCADVMHASWHPLHSHIPAAHGARFGDHCRPRRVRQVRARHILSCNIRRSHFSNSIALSHRSMAHVSANWRYTRPQLTEPGVGDIIIKVRSCMTDVGRISLRTHTHTHTHVISGTGKQAPVPGDDGPDQLHRQ
jgi:hypothetical protein